jgi:hypothetical protein
MPRGNVKKTCIMVIVNCSGFQKHVQIATSSFQKPFSDGTSSFKETWNN